MTVPDTEAAGTEVTETVADRIAEHVPHSGRFRPLDGFRALAALCVVLTHVGFQTGAALSGPYAGLLSRLDIGVTIFFLLSGFLLSRPYLVSHHRGTAALPVRVYAWHRFLRIMPAYWLAVVGGMLLIEENRTRPPSDWVEQLLVVQTYVHGGLILGLSQMWSLGTEIAFYVALPVIGFLLLRKRSDDPAARWRRQWRMVILLLLVAQVYRAVVFALPGGPGVSLYWLPNYLDWFGLGIALAVLHERPRGAEGRITARLLDVAAMPGVCWTIALSAFWVSTTWLAGPYNLAELNEQQSFTRHLLYAAAAFFAMLPAVAGPGADRVSRFFGSAPLVWLGTVSYGVFLWNMALLLATMSVLGFGPFSGRFWLVLSLELAVTVPVAAFSWYVVERRAMRLRHLVH
jgi:peptidoglycan/LPS O-acetylase OafA/YrhL